MIGIYFLLAFLFVTTTGELLQLYTEADEDGFTYGPNFNFPDLGAIMSQRSYAYVTAGVIMVMFFALIYCHVVSVRKSRLLEQYEQQGQLPEWSPLLINRKNIRPPEPYEQVV
uniref:Protein-export membrane protein SecG n=1 Tax=Caenorhabditis tropicalis TaxID=1561998 RepID=A0A1I7V4I6_9PELO